MASNDPRLDQAKVLHKWLHSLAESAFNPAVSEIEPGLYIGGIPDKTFPKVDAVLNVADKLYPEPEVSYLTDNKTADAKYWMPIYDRAPFPGIDWLNITTGIIDLCRTAGFEMLVHCERGWSRSGMVMVAYIMKRDKLSVDDALDRVLEKRAIAPNPWFLVGLDDWQHYLETGEDKSTTGAQNGNSQSVTGTRTPLSR